MFDIAPTELLLVAFVALVVIGPKDLPKAMRFVGHWVGRARGVARQFRSGFDAMVREAELQEMEKKWAEENARIMREFPLDPNAVNSHPMMSAQLAPPDAETEGSLPTTFADESQDVTMTPAPVIRDAGEVVSAGLPANAAAASGEVTGAVVGQAPARKPRKRASATSAIPDVADDSNG